MVGGGGGSGRHGPNERPCGAQRRYVRIAGGRFDLVLSGAPLWKSRAEAPLPDFVGAGLVRSPDTECIQALRHERDRGCEVSSWLEHTGATTGGELGRERATVLFVRCRRFVALRRNLYSSGHRFQP